MHHSYIQCLEQSLAHGWLPILLFIQWFEVVMSSEGWEPPPVAACGGKMMAVGNEGEV